MQVILYNSESNLGGRFKELFETVNFPENTMIEKTPEGFLQILRQPSIYYSRIVVLFVQTEEEFYFFLSLKELLSNYQLILILNREGLDIMTKAHTLRPRYLTYADSDFCDIVAVLNKLIAHESSILN